MIENTPLKSGEYDLANISIIGYDPITGRSFDECADEWDAAAARVTLEADSLRWWQIIRRIKIARKIHILQQRQGLPPGFFG